MNDTIAFDPAFIRRNLDKGEFGLERESLRMDGNGYLAHTKHPFGARCDITRDFCENQIELITDVFESVPDVLRQMSDLQTEVVLALLQQPTGKEYLWPFSNPPYVRGEEDIVIAQFERAQEEKTQYRQYLAAKYGKKKMLFSGIHLNYSFADEMLRDEYRILESSLRNPEHNTVTSWNAGTAKQLQTQWPTYQAYKNQVYLQLAQKLTVYTWLIVYLTAASPVLDRSFLYDTQEASPSVHDEWTVEDLTRYASVRCGERGYWNAFMPVFDYQNLDSYIQSIEAYIQSGKLQGVSELYYPLRLKPRGENTLEYLKEKGVNHIELRMLDVNPLSPIGLFQEDVEFLHYFMVYLHHQEELQLTAEEQRNAILNEKQAAEFDDSKIRIREYGGGERPIREAAQELLNQMELFFSELEARTALRSIRYQKDKLRIPHNRYADRIRAIYESDYVKSGVALAKEYAELTRQCSEAHTLRERIS